MPEHMPISILFSNEGDVVVEFPEEALTVSLPVTCIGANLYRLDAVPYLSERASYGDIVEATPGKDGGLRFVRVVQPSGWSTHQYILCRERYRRRRHADHASQRPRQRRVLGGSLRRPPLHLLAARLDL